ncbi:hypothetical protein [Enemella sp. A6]|uniref:hypothetical protein n=1 Tax=Enemella sp. A6 TaxID=3440152 RepID=UPI003EBD7194
MSFTVDPDELDRHRSHLVSMQETAEGDIVAKASNPKVLLAYGLMYYGIIGFWMMVANAETRHVVKETGTALEYTAATIGDILQTYADAELTHAQKAKEIEDEVGELDGKVR